MGGQGGQPVVLSLPWARADQAGHRQEAEAAGLWAGTWQKTGCRLSMPRTRLAGSWLRVRLGLSPASGGAHQSPPPGPGALPAPSGIPSALQLQNALLSGQTATCSHRRKLGPTVITSESGPAVYKHCAFGKVTRALQVWLFHLRDEDAGITELL